MPPAATSSKVAVGGGHKVTTVADGALASAAPPAEPDGAACVLPHRIPVDRLCVSRRSPPVAYSTGADGRVCCSGLGGNARASFGERGVVAVESWQFDLALLEPPGTSRGWLCGGGALAGTAVGCVKVWDAGDGRLERSMTGHAGPVRSLAVADPSGVLASGGDDGTCRIWDLAREGACVACSPAAPDGLRVARRAARDVFVVGDAAGAARAWDAPGAFASETGAAVPGGVVGLAADGDHWYTLGRCFQDWGDPARARGLPKASEVAKWDPRKLAAPSETVGFHQDVGVTLELCDAGLLSASRDGGVALWGTGGGLAGELRDAAPALVKRQGANEPAIRGNEVGEILNDDLSRVPYEVRGPAARRRGSRPSSSPCARRARGKVALAKARGAAKTPVPPTPPAKKAPSPTPADDDDADAFGAMFDFRAAPARAAPAKPAVTDAERRAQRDAQRAADRNVDDSMAQYMSKKAARASAAGGGSRRPASDRLRKLRGEA
ncbi:WD repeat-containing protein [Aureococcus anophagefferens]|nr:WD repeat-containing protein [Aureococcus anophagefferens]